MVVVEVEGKRQQVSPRISLMIEKLLEAERMIEAAGKGKVELNFAGQKVSRSVTVCEV